MLYSVNAAKPDNYITTALYKRMDSSLSLYNRYDSRYVFLILLIIILIIKYTKLIRMSLFFFFLHFDSIIWIP